MPRRQSQRSPGVVQAQQGSPSKRQKKQKQAAANRATTLDGFLQIDDCKFPSRFSRLGLKKLKTMGDGTRVCCSEKCCTKYTPATIQLARAWWNRLAKGDRKTYVAERSERLENHKRTTDVYIYFLDTETSLKAHFTSSLGPDICQPQTARNALDKTSRRLPFSQSQTIPVCSRYLCWLFATGRTQLFNNKTGRRSFNGNSGLGGVHDQPRESAKFVRVSNWLEEAKAAHLHCPDKPQVILPWATKGLTHAAFVVESEQALTCEWAPKIQFNPCDIGELNVEKDYEGDVEDAGDDGDDAVEDAQRFRYGNSWLGLKDTFPEHEDIACKSYFNFIWREKFFEIKVRKWMPFSKCGKCWELRTAADATTDHDHKAELLKEYRLHLADVAEDRYVYTSNKMKSQNRTGGVLSIIIDGADNTDHSLPYFHHRTHESQAAWRQRMHVIGAIAHGHGVWAFTCPGHVAQGHNVTIQALWEVLRDLIKRARDKGELAQFPDHLVLQLDNTTKQNKGKFLFAFVYLLVEYGPFRKATINFLPVGHTHIDIDQFFSRLTVYLRTHNALSRPHM
jgi:hypothetical protein